MDVKLAKILAQATSLAEKISIPVKNREFFISDHIFQSLRGGLGPDYLHLASTRDGHVDEIKQILVDFLKGLDLSEVLSDKESKSGVIRDSDRGFPPVDESYVNKMRRVVVVGRKPHVIVYLVEQDEAKCLRDYLVRTGVSSEVFLKEPGFEIVSYRVDELVANEIYRIAGEGLITVHNKQSLMNIVSDRSGIDLPKASGKLPRNHGNGRRSKSKKA